MNIEHEIYMEPILLHTLYQFGEKNPECYKSFCSVGVFLLHFWFCFIFKKLDLKKAKYAEKEQAHAHSEIQTFMSGTIQMNG